VHTTLALALGLAATHLAGSGLASGVVAAVGILVGGIIGKVWPPAPSTASRHLLDRLTSRDGLYAMLAVFVVLGLFRPTLLPSLMLIVAAGTHVYWLARTLVLVGGGPRYGPPHPPREVPRRSRGASRSS
jgi:hypothetical protein